MNHYHGIVVYFGWFFVFTLATGSVVGSGHNSSASKRFCTKNVTKETFTSCVSCSTNRRVQCPAGSVRVSFGTGLAGCRYQLKLGNNRIMMPGCRHKCRRDSTLRECCQGYWGLHCQECPGGALNQCHGRGICNQGIYGNGSCTCQSSFAGTACEKCAKHYQYGPQCQGECRCHAGTCNSGINGDGTCYCDSGYSGRYCDQLITTCETLVCHRYGRCTNGQDGPVCSCLFNYEGDGLNNCTAIDPCISSPCHPNATCVYVNPGSSACSCKDGYRGDGVFCQEIDPCQRYNGGCDITTSKCVYDGPGKSHCECYKGYNIFNNTTCSLIDLCASNSTICHPNASCTTVSPGQVQCTCNKGFIGNGKRCYGNILLRLKDVNSEDGELRGKLTKFISYIEAALPDALQYHGPFTLFVTIDSGINFDSAAESTTAANSSSSALGPEIGEGPLHTDRIRQILKQHLVIGQYTLDELANMTMFYTLQGTSAELKLKRNRGIEYHRLRLQGGRDRARIVKNDILAANGFIHVIDRIMGRLPDILGDPEKSIFDQIRTDGHYNILETLIQKSAMNNILKQPGPFVVFAPGNDAWKRLPESTVDYLLSEDARFKLIQILNYHIVKGSGLMSQDLVNTVRFTTIGHTSIQVSITDKGQIQLNGKVNVTQTDVPARNGYYHHIDGILIPPGMDLLPHRCDISTTKQVRGSCGPCHREPSCPAVDDVPLEHTVSGCRYWLNLGVRYSAYIGCARMCNRTYVHKRCCQNFYSHECKPCPGGFLNPCNGKGKCNDGYHKNGTCQCDDGFTGTACQKCTDPKKYGRNCAKKCQCLNGDCDNGLHGSGECKPGPCWPGFIGKNCDKRQQKCWIRRCHAHAVCENDIPYLPEFLDHSSTIRETYRSSPSDLMLKFLPKCVCLPGYDGDGENCVEINPCNEKSRGNCHLQASCIHDGPGESHCKCNTGWVGDGFYCYQGSSCEHPDDCHPNAECWQTSPGNHLCVCSEHFHGNGTYCVPNNVCLQDNGGCHEQAKCEPNGPGERNCTCFEGFGGDGLQCFGSIFNEIVAREKLTRVLQLLMRIPPEDNILADMKDNFTVFVPDNVAMLSFIGQESNEYWSNEDNLFSLLSYHTLHGIYSIEELENVTYGQGHLETLMAGNAVNITNRNGVYYVNSARVLEANIPTINGFVNIIDEVLEPYPIMSDRNAPTLAEMLTSKGQFSIFLDYLNETGMLEKMANLDQTFTLFAPVDSAIENKNLKISSLYLSYYVVPTLITTRMLNKLKKADTLLGRNNQREFPLIFSKTGPKYYVNDIRIVQADMIVFGGAVQGIAGVFSPQINRCDTIGKRNRLVLRCCPGFFDYECRECPGGVDQPCNNHGTCNDGIHGNGTCICTRNFDGERCEHCIRGKMGPNCDQPAPVCDEDNGGCHGVAKCLEYKNGTTHCICPPGYRGDGRTCEQVCESNGKCYPPPMCSWQYRGFTLCTCPIGFSFIDDSTKSRCGKLPDPCDTDNGGCDKRATCTYKHPQGGCVMKKYEDTQQRGPDYKVVSIANQDVCGQECLREKKCVSATYLKHRKSCFLHDAIRKLNVNIYTTHYLKKCSEKGVPIVKGNLKCKCKHGLVGNGTFCNGNITDALLTMEQAKQFHKVLMLSALHSTAVNRLMTSLSKEVVTFFVPSTLELKTPLISSDQLADLIFPGRFKMSEDMNGTIITSLSEQKFNITAKNSTLSSNGQLKYFINELEIVDPNIPVTNGWIHFTSQMLPKPTTRPVEITTATATTITTTTAAQPQQLNTQKPPYLLYEALWIVIAVVALLVLIIIILCLIYKIRTANSNDVSLIATFSKDSDEYSFETFTNTNADEAEKMKKTGTETDEQSDINYDHSFNNPLYDVQGATSSENVMFPL
ncbi:stabilin-2-like [Tubulanus polymorphus]|uniref:stabilin-2-like n=1 Tax=Tubulanus polymorphus TaxID=672921 RepID=UPI003DA59B21